MKNYLNLVPISAKIHRKQSKMTRICIALAVFLVAVMFGLSDIRWATGGEYSFIKCTGADRWRDKC